MSNLAASQVVEDDHLPYYLYNVVAKFIHFHCISFEVFLPSLVLLRPPVPLGFLLLEEKLPYLSQQLMLHHEINEAWRQHYVESPRVIEVPTREELHAIFPDEGCHQQ